MRKQKTDIEKVKDQISESATIKSMGIFREHRDYKDENA
jgi:hypothetical protein